MKRLLLLRHGKSDWDANYGADSQRPLSERGEKAARAIGRFVAQTHQVPDAVISSPAVRARRTAELAIEAGSWQRNMSINEDLYGASAGMALSVVQGAPDSADSLLLTGHEPTTSQLIRLFTEAHVIVRTATLVAIDLPDSTWRSASPGFGALAWMINPRLLTEGELDLG